MGKPRARFELGTGDLEAGTRNTRPPHLVISYCDTFDAPDVTVELLLLLELLAAGPAGDQPAGQPVPQALVMRISHKVEKTLAAMLARVPLSRTMRAAAAAVLGDIVLGDSLALCLLEGGASFSCLKKKKKKIYLQGNKQKKSYDPPIFSHKNDP